MTTRSPGPRGPAHPAARLPVVGLIAGTALASLARPALAGAQTGTITGRVLDTAGAPIPGAVVHVSGTTLGANSGGAGRYQVNLVPAGTRTVVVRRVGFATDSFTVTVNPGAAAARDVRLRAAAAQLAAVVVKASPRLNETREAALAVRAAAPNLVNVLSGDDIRALPNANAAEALARMPGVSTERDEGEGKFVQIRGTEPRLSNVTIDGAHVPGTEQGDRIPKLDAVPSDLLGAIEISKTLTADQDADAIGGSVNLVTKTPEGPPRGYVALQGGQQDQLSRQQAQGSLMYGGRFGPEERLGVLLGGTLDRNNRSINDVEPAWTVDNAGRVTPVEWDQRDYLYDRTRSGGVGALDYRFAGGSTVFLRGLYSQFHNYGTRYRFDVATNGDSTPVAAGPSGVGTGAQFTREVSHRTPDEQMYGLTAGGRIPGARLEADYALSWAGTSQRAHNYRFNDFTYNGPDGNGVPVSYDGSDPNLPRYRFVSAADSVAALNPANYALSRYSITEGLSTGRDLGAQLNALLHFALGGNPSAFRFGAKVRGEHKSYVNNSQYFAADSGAAVPLTTVLANFSDPSYYRNLASGFVMGPEPNEGAIEAFENSHPSLFTNTTNVVRNKLQDYSGTEGVYSAYGMNTVDVGRLRLNVGLRAELTHSSYTGNVASTPVDSAGNRTGPTQVVAAPGAQTYLDLFPSAQLRYAFTPHTNVRFAVTRGIARPNYLDLAPHLSGDLCAACRYQFGNLSAGNPDLKPQHAWNVDLLAEHYFPAAGILSGGVFYKRITDFIYTREFVYGGPVTEFDGYYGTRPENGGDAHLAGAEVQYTQRFSTLPGALAGLGVDLNWTHVESKAAILGDTASSATALAHPVVVRHAMLPRQAPNVANLGLTYDLGRVSARASWQYQGASIYGYGDGTPTPNGDTWFYPHSQVDASVVVTVTPRIAVQLQGLNLNNAVFGFYNGTAGTRFDVQREVYGRSFVVGFRYGFGQGVGR